MKGSCSALVSRFFFGGVFDAGRRSGINRETVIKGRNHGGGGGGEGSGEGNEREWVSCENPWKVYPAGFGQLLRPGQRGSPM